MNRIFYKIMPLLLATVALMASCRKQENKAVYDPSEAQALLTSSATSVVLTAENEKETVVTLSWEKPDFGYEASVTYTLLFDQNEGDFSDPVSVNVGIDLLQQSFTAGALNQITKQMGLPADSKATIQAMLVAQVKPLSGNTVNLEAIHSVPVAIKVTPYTTEITYPTIYGVGAFQGWNPAAGVPIYSANMNDKFEGYLNFTGSAAADLEFKFISQQNWDGPNYGKGGEPVTDGFRTTGTLDASGGNLQMPAAGYYRVKVDLGALTYEAYQTSWGLIGSATPTGWDSDTDMTYDAATNTMVIESINLTAGEIKFRANDAWDFNYGYDAAAGVLTEGGPNIAVAEAGTYKVVLDLRHSARYTYSLTKL